MIENFNKICEVLSVEYKDDDLLEYLKFLNRYDQNYDELNAIELFRKILANGIASEYTEKFYRRKIYNEAINELKYYNVFQDDIEILLDLYADVKLCNVCIDHRSEIDDLESMLNMKLIDEKEYEYGVRELGSIKQHLIEHVREDFEIGLKFLGKYLSLV
jgi:hypothetical protein